MQAVTWTGVVLAAGLGLGACSEDGNGVLTDAAVGGSDAIPVSDGGSPSSDAGGALDAVIGLGDTGVLGGPDAGGDAGTPIPPAAIYVDHSIATTSCVDYSPAARSCGSGGARAFRTIAGAAGAAREGDTVVLRGGTYAEALVPGASRVTFRAHPGERPEISGDLSPAIDISDRTEIVLEGLVVTGVRRWLLARRTRSSVIAGCTFNRATDPGGSSKTGLFFEEAVGNRIIGNTIEDSTQDNLALIKSDRNLIEGNTIKKAAHVLWTIKCGNENVLRGNRFHNQDQKIGEIYDCDGVGYDHQFTISDATKRNVVEGNRFEYTPSSGDASPYAGIQYAGQRGLIRRNLFHDTVGPALDLTLYGGEAEHTTDNRIVHNVFFKSSFAGVSLAGARLSFTGNVFKNNVLAGSRFVANDRRWTWYTQELDGKPVQLMAGRRDGFLFERNVFFGDAPSTYWITSGDRTSSSNPPQHDLAWWQANHADLFRMNLEQDPRFADAAAHDFSPAAGSPLIDAGVFLTRARAAGSGTALPVEDALYFSDGFGLVGGDEIQLEGSTERARVTAVDAGAGTLTLDRALTWAAGQGVALSYQGASPDIGAIER